MITETCQLTATVHGRVQGVSFRYFTTLCANEVGCVGWVRNNRDGTVSCVAQGTKQQLEQLLAFLHKGSPAAVVKRVDWTWEEPSSDFTTFETRYTVG